MYIGVIKYIDATKMWEYQRCNYKTDKYNWEQIHGHLRSKHNNENNDNRVAQNPQDTNVNNIENEPDHSGRELINREIDDGGVRLIYQSACEAENTLKRALKIKCVERGQEFTRIKNINQHQTWHNDLNKNYDTISPYCPRNFSRRSTINRHLYNKNFHRLKNTTPNWKVVLRGLCNAYHIDYNQRMGNETTHIGFN